LTDSFLCPSCCVGVTAVVLVMYSVVLCCMCQIKFLKSKEGVAMVQMGDNASCSRAMSNLRECYIFNSKMGLGSVHVQLFACCSDSQQGCVFDSTCFKMFVTMFVTLFLTFVSNVKLSQ